MSRANLPRPAALRPSARHLGRMLLVLALLGLVLTAFGVPQRIGRAARRTIAHGGTAYAVTGTRMPGPTTIVLAPDVSGSMIGSAQYGEFVRWSRPQLQYLATSTAMAVPGGGDDRLVLMPWSDHPDLQASTANWGRIAALLGSPSNADGGGTSILPALKRADNAIQSTRGLIVVFTDGQVDDDPGEVTAELDRLRTRAIDVAIVAFGVTADALRSQAPWSDRTLVDVVDNTDTTVAAVIARHVGLAWSGT